MRIKAGEVAVCALAAIAMAVGATVSAGAPTVQEDGIAQATPAVSAAAGPTALFPAASELKNDRPRLLLRPRSTPRAITLDQLRSIPRDEEFVRMLGRLRGEKSAAAKAMVYLLTGEKAAAEAAVARLRAYKAVQAPNSFAVYFGLRELALAYDWLHDYAGFSVEVRREVRLNARPLVEAGLRISDDHLFHNYVWASAGGLALWALATVGEDAESDTVYDTVRARLNERLFPGMAYLSGAPGESMWYWALYDFSPAALAVLAAQSASERDIADRIREQQGDWLVRQFGHTLGCTLPDLSYTPFGDTKTGKEGVTGPDGGVTHEMAGLLCGLSWLLDSGEGAWFDRWIAGRRGDGRFYGETAIFYFIYARHLKAAPVAPPLALLAGSGAGGHVVTRSNWEDDATVVALRATDHFGDHNHLDQGSFMIWRNGWLAIDPRVYRKVRGPQQASEHHNTLLIGGRGQRAVHGQDYRALADFTADLASGRKLETGDMLFFRNEPAWTAAAAQFAQAYPEGTVSSCVRQLLFVRPDTVVVVDRLAAPEGQPLGEVQWLLHAPKGLRIDAGVVISSNGRSWLQCRQILPGSASPTQAASLDPACERVSFPAKGGRDLLLVHAIELGEGVPAEKPAAVAARALANGGCEVSAAGRIFVFDGGPKFMISPASPPAGS